MKTCSCNTPDTKCNFFAQYGVQANPLSNSDLPLFPLFQEGNKIHLEGSSILLAPGYLYLINYLLTSTPEADGYMQIIPKINGQLNLLYSFFAPAGSKEKNTSAAGSFTTNAALIEEAAIAFSLTYPSTARNIDISGAISVTPLIKIHP